MRSGARATAARKACTHASAGAIGRALGLVSRASQGLAAYGRDRRRLEVGPVASHFCWRWFMLVSQRSGSAARAW